MITIEQIRGARGLLGWSQDDLARHTGLSKNAVNNLELRKVKPRLSTMETIKSVLEAAGVQFTDGPGVKLAGNLLKVRMFEGSEALIHLWDDIFDSVKKSGDRLLNGVKEKTYEGHDKKNLHKFFDGCRKRNINARILLEHGDTHFIDPTAEYRWARKGKFSKTPYYVYGEKYAILLWEPILRILVIENKLIADSYRQQFDALWDEAALIPKSYMQKFEDRKQ